MKLWKSIVGAALVLIVAASHHGHAQVVPIWSKGPGSSSGGGAPDYPLLPAVSADCTAPPYSFTGDTNTGVASTAADTVVVCTGGVARYTVSSALITVVLPITTTSQVTSTLATGTAPFVVSSTTNVANLNASSLSGATFAAPGPIGGGTPAAITGTTITATTQLVGVKVSESTTAGQGVTVAAGTATTDVPALSVTRTNNNAAVATGVKFTFTDTTSAAGFLPFQVLGGASGVTNLLSTTKAGNTASVMFTAPNTGMGYHANKFTASGGYECSSGSVDTVRCLITTDGGVDGRVRIGNGAGTVYAIVSGATPVIGTCGTSPSLVGTDSAMLLTVGTGGVATSCAATFSAAFTNAPICVSNSDTDIVALKVSASTTVVTVTATGPFTASSKLHVHCIGRS